MDGDTVIMGMPLAGEASASRHHSILKQLSSWSPGEFAALIHVDLRNLRDINRLSGAAEGDRLIRRVEQALQQWSRGHAVTGRLWSNEFIAAKSIDHAQSAGEEAAHLRDMLSEMHYDSAVGSARVGVSLGMSIWRHGDDWARVLSEANQACIMSKRRGLNQIVRFGTGVAEMPIYSPAAVTEFRNLMKAGRLSLHAQPIMDIGGDEPRMAKAEFLIRMERNGVYMPLAAGIIETLENYGLAAELDRFSSTFLLDWLDANPEVLGRVHGLSMNLSGASLVDGRFMDDLYRDVKNARLPAGKLCFEITETSAIAHLDVAAEVIGAFKSIGCRFSLDDFGSGLCSFGYLNTLPVDE
ncbi:MAG: hypothetical protein K0Q76_2814, partial [Panacagrimonas sp.]